MGRYDGFATVKMRGNLVKDPEVKYQADGTAVCSFCVAVNRSNGEFKRVDFIDCVKIGMLAEDMRDAFRKGDLVEIDGVLMQQRWKAKDGYGRSRVVVEVKVIMRFSVESRDSSAE